MARPALCHLFFLGKLKKLKWYKIKIRFIGLEVLVGFRVTRLLGHGPQLLRGLCPVHVLGGGGRTCCLKHT